MIWILTDSEWLPVAKRVDAHLAALGEQARIIDSTTVADLEVIVEGSSLQIMLGSEHLELPSAVVVFRLPIPHHVETVGLAADAQSFVREQWQIMGRGLLLALEHLGVPILNSSATVLRDEKTHQLLLAHQAGFATPLTVQTATGGQLSEHWHEEEVVAIKQFRPMTQVDETAGRVRWTKTLALKQQALADGLRASKVKSPSVVQPLVDAPFEHRVVVVGDEVFGARTAREGENSVDVRSVPVAEAGAVPSELPDHVRASAVRLAELAGATFATMDVLETVSGDYVFLDLNCGGHFLWVEQLCGWPITQAIATHAARRDSCP